MGNVCQISMRYQFLIAEGCYATCRAIGLLLWRGVVPGVLRVDRDGVGALRCDRADLVDRQRRKRRVGLGARSGDCNG